MKEGAIRCIQCGNYVGATFKGNSSSQSFADSNKSISGFKFWSMHPITLICVIVYIIYIFSTYDGSSWFYTGLGFFIGYYIAKEWAPRINGSQSWAFAIGFFFGLFGLVCYWLYYRNKIDKITFQTNSQIKEVDKSNINQYSKFWYNKGVEYSESNEYEKALQAYDQAIAIDDKDPDTWNNKCYVLIKLGRYEEAINAGKTGVNLAPQDPVICDTLRNAYLANNNPEKASECLNKTFIPHNGSTQNKPLSNTFNKPLGIDFIQVVKICGFLLFILIIAIAAINYRDTLVKSSSGSLYGIVFFIFLIGILYEGWKAVKQ